MSGSSSSGRGSAVSAPLDRAASAAAVTAEARDERIDRTRAGRRKMWLVLAICAAPVLASYLTYYVIRPTGRTNYSALIEPLRPVPAGLPLQDARSGRAVDPATLKGQWLIVVVSGGACDATCERLLWLQRQLRESLGRDADRVDKLWLVDDNAPLSSKALAGVTTHTDAAVLRVPADALEAWLEPAPGQRLESQVYIVDPLGNWMMRTPPDPDPASLKRDIEKLLRASAGWDRPGR